MLSSLLFDWLLLERAARGFFFPGKLAVAHAHTRVPTRDVSTPMQLDTTETKRHKTVDTGLPCSSSNEEKRRRGEGAFAVDLAVEDGREGRKEGREEEKMEEGGTEGGRE